MRNLAPSFARLVALAALLSGQPSWTSRSEYDLYSRIPKENVPFRRIELLREWESLYPKSELEPLRLQMLAVAYMKAGQTVNAFATATRLLKVELDDEQASWLIVTLVAIPAEPCS